MKFSVLAITEDAGFVRPLRLDMPLLSLKKQGLIDDYFVTDPTLFNVPDDQLFDVVWLQRIRFSTLIEHLAECLGNRYLYDIDDFMIGAPSYVPQEELHKKTVSKAIQSCKVLTVPSMRLARLLGNEMGMELTEKTLVCPNGFEFPDALRIPSRPNGLLLTHSDSLPLSESQEVFFRAVEQFTQLHDLPIYHVGSPFPGIESWGGRVVSLGRVPFWHYHSLLASMPPLIGLAPLETHGDKDTLDFIRGKSDIKMMSYGGFGHPSLYSDSPPYTETDLKAGLIVTNTFDSWLEGLEAVFTEGWHRLDIEQHDVAAKRHIDKIARENWHRALAEARLDKPVAGKAIKYSSGRLHYYLGAVRHLVLSQDHGFRRELRANIPDFAVRILRRFLIRI